MNNKVLVYVVYGQDVGYYHGAVASVLSFLAAWSDDTPPLIVVLTEQPQWFVDLPVLVWPLLAEQKAVWSLDGRYAFRMKNRGLAWVMDTLLAQQRVTADAQVLFCDADTFFTRNPAPLFALQQGNGVVMFRREHRLNSRDYYQDYIRDLAGRTLRVRPDWDYVLDANHFMWGSLLVGLTMDKRTALDDADALMVAMLDYSAMPTIEQFCLAEVLSRDYVLKEGRHWVQHYSRPNQKNWVLPQLAELMPALRGQSLTQQLALLHQVRFRRPWWLLLRQKLGFGRLEG